MKERRAYVPVTERKGFRVLGLLYLLVVLLWAASFVMAPMYPKFSSFLWREGWFFAFLALVYWTSLGREDRANKIRWEENARRKNAMQRNTQRTRV